MAKINSNLKVWDFYTPRFNASMGVIVLPKDKNEAPSYLFDSEGFKKDYFKHYRVFYNEVEGPWLDHIVSSLNDFHRRLKEVEILPLPEEEELDVTSNLWECQYTYWPNRYNWRESFSCPSETALKIVQAIQREIDSPVVLKDDKGYWRLPVPEGTEGVIIEKYAPTVILPRGYSRKGDHVLKYRNIGRGALTEYWGYYKI